MSLQRVYQIMLIILGLVALVLSIPSISDFLVMSGMFLSGYLSVGYIMLWIVSGLNGVVRKAVLVTWLGLFSFIFSLLPIIGTIYNGILIIVTILFLIKDFKMEILEKEEAKRKKDENKKEPTVFDVFGKEYLHDDDDYDD